MPHQANSEKKTPYELFFGKKPDLSNLRTLDAKCTFITTNQTEANLLTEDWRDDLWDTATESKDYVVQIKGERKFRVARNVTFFETCQKKKLESVVIETSTNPTNGPILTELQSYRNLPDDADTPPHTTVDIFIEEEPYHRHGQHSNPIESEQLDDSERKRKSEQQVNSEYSHKEEMRKSHSPEQQQHLGKKINPTAGQRNEAVSLDTRSAESFNMTDTQQSTGKKINPVIGQHNDEVSLNTLSVELPSVTNKQQQQGKKITPAAGQLLEVSFDIPDDVEQDVAHKKATPVAQQNSPPGEETTSKNNGGRHQLRERKLPKGFWTGSSNLAEERILLNHCDDEDLLRKWENTLDIIALMEYEGLDARTPKNFKEASLSPGWRTAMNSEYGSLISSGSIKLVPLPPWKKTNRKQMDFQNQGELEQLHCQIESQTCSQRLHTNRGSGFLRNSCTSNQLPRNESLLCHSCDQGTSSKTIGHGTAFLHLDIEEEIYMDQPEGCEKKGENGEKLYCQVMKSIYGLKQAGRNWNRTLSQFLIEYGFTQSKTDPCLFYIRVEENGKEFYLVVYVDDIFTADNDDNMRVRLVEALKKRFPVTDMGKATWGLGMKITQTPSSIHIDQEKYINDLLEHFGLEKSNPAVTPATPNVAPNSEAYMADRTLYLKLVGSIIYLAVVTRPDIAYAVSRAGQHMQNPTTEDLKAAKRILKYVKGCATLGPTYWKDGNKELLAYADSDWGGDLSTRRSTTGIALVLAGAVILWTSKRQHTVAGSSTEAEYMAAGMATQDIVYMRSLLKDLGLEQKDLLSSDKTIKALST